MTPSSYYISLIDDDMISILITNAATKHFMIGDVVTHWTIFSWMCIEMKKTEVCDR